MYSSASSTGLSRRKKIAVVRPIVPKGLSVLSVRGMESNKLWTIARCSLGLARQTTILMNICVCVILYVYHAVYIWRGRGSITAHCLLYTSIIICDDPSY